MSEPNPFDLLVDRIREVVRAEIAAALKNIATSSNGNSKQSKPHERVLTEQEARALKEKDWLKADELAGLFRLPATWFEERGRAGEIERTKPGRYVLFKRRDVEAYLERKKQNS